MHFMVNSKTVKGMNLLNYISILEKSRITPYENINVYIVIICK